MREFLITISVGIVVGIIDIIPMIKMKINKHDILSAFTFYLIIPFIIFNTNIEGMAWYLKGGIITFLLSLPIQIMVYQNDKKAVLIMSTSSIVLGTLVGVAGHILL